VDLSWRGGKPVEATLAAALDGVHQIKPPRGATIARVRSGGRDVPVTSAPDGAVTLSVQAGQRYQITFG
jgi:hypothetical protein